MKTTITKPVTSAGIHANLVQFTDDGFEMICVESYPSGFTNHRVSIRRHPNGWVCESSAREAKDVMRDLHAVKAWLRFERCAANPFLATAARAALAYLNGEPQSTTITPTADRVRPLAPKLDPEGRNALSWIVVNPDGKLLAVLDSESEAYWFTRNRGHAHGAVYFQAPCDYAAANDLLAIVSEYVESYGPMHDKAKGSQPCGCSVCRARAAIAKAQP